MGCFKQVAQLIGDDMRIDLRRRDVGVAQQQLHRAQIGAARQQVRRKSMAQCVRRHTLEGNASLHGEVFQQLPQAAAREAARGPA